MEQEKKIDIVGNGASNSMYTHQKNFVVSFNVPQHGFRYDTLSIIDNKPLHWMKTNSWQPTVPVLCTTVIKELAQKLGIGGDWFDYFKHKPHVNAGHHALLHFGNLHQEIHLWGFDSMFSEDLTSQSDVIIPRNQRPKLNKHWYPQWCNIMDNITATVYVHVPQGKQLEIKHERLIETQDLAIPA